MEDYNEYYGFFLVYHDGKLSGSKALKHHPDGIDISGPNKVYVMCSECYEYMKYTGDRFVCERCRASVDEHSVYDVFVNENEEWRRENDIWN